ncbi:MAG: hypothetical protein LBM26_03930 [Methanobrevibacter sp.]|jgi:hypothetical protein|nr:hypothetical protein [Methanobrevibacter sp.]
MELLWFYIAIVLAISDEIHSLLMWSFLGDFYTIFAGLVTEIVPSKLQSWIVHEVIESIFHFILLSLVFFSVEIGILAALIHLVIDLGHSLTMNQMNWVEHRALHFVIESLFFIGIFGL